MIKAAKRNVREEISRSTIGKKFRYVIDEYAIYSQLNMTSYFKEFKGSLSSDYFFDKKLAYEDLKKKWNKILKGIQKSHGAYLIKEVNMDPRRFELVYNVRRLK